MSKSRVGVSMLSRPTRHLGEKGVWCGEHYATNIKGAGGRTERRATPRQAPVKCWSIIIWCNFVTCNKVAPCDGTFTWH